MLPETKICAHCQIEKPANEFSIRRVKDDNKVLRIWCKNCVEADSKHYYDQFPEKKLCGSCRVEKPSTDFWIRRRRDKVELASWCKSCSDTKARQWRKDNPNKKKISNKRNYQDNKDTYRTLSLEKMYGINLEQYRQMHEEQNGLCAICGEPETAKRNGVARMLCVDHNHSTGQVRALLCARCNHAIGQLRESPEHCIKAAEYLIHYATINTGAMEQLDAVSAETTAISDAD